MGNSLNLTEDQWWHDLNEAKKQYENERFSKGIIKLTDQAKDFIRIAKEKNVPWKVIVVAYNKNFKEDKKVTAKQLKDRWYYWQTKEDDT